jgi:hypothetical protein
MKNQFANSYANLAGNVRIYLFLMIMAAYDMYIYARHLSWKTFMWFLKAYYSAAIAWPDPLRSILRFQAHGSAEVIYCAYTYDSEITSLIRWFYQCDTIQSTASMRRWLSYFNVRAQRIRILYTKVPHIVLAAELNLADDREELTGVHIHESDVRLAVLPHITLMTISGES